MKLKIEENLFNNNPMSFSQIKLLVLDIDGTLVGESNEITQQVQSAVKVAQENKITVGVATGRMYRSAVRFHQILKAEQPLIAYNGAWMQCPNTQKKYQHLPVSSKIAQELLKYFQSTDLNPYFELHVYWEDQLYVKEITQQTKRYAERCQIEAIAVDNLEDILKADPTKVLALARFPEMIPKLIKDLRKLYTPADLHLTQSETTLVELINPQVNKGKAVKYLAEEILGITRDNVMAIGDNYNDLEMLEYAGTGIAMGSAPLEVKEIADWVAPDVDGDGVAVALEKFLSQELKTK